MKRKKEMKKRTQKEHAGLEEPREDVLAAGVFWC